jgi:hypothetical protein
MVKINYFRDADCRLWRTPSINISEVEEEITRRLVECWKNGRNLDRAIDSIVKDSEIVGKLSDKMKDALDFQRGALILSTEKKSEEALDAINDDYKTRKAEVKRRYGETIKPREKEVEQLRKSAQEISVSHDAAMQRLEEMRYRIGTKVTLDKKAERGLLQIQEILAEEDSPVIAPASPGGKAYEPVEKPRLDDKIKHIKAVQPTTTTSIEPAKNTYSKPHKPGVFNKIVDILNYKLW